jgi:hypothetical protein
MTNEELYPELHKALRKSDNHKFDMYRFNLALNDWFAYLDYTEKHEGNGYLQFVNFLNIKPKFIINLN